MCAVNELINSTRLWFKLDWLINLLSTPITDISDSLTDTYLYICTAALSFLVFPYCQVSVTSHCHPMQSKIRWHCLQALSHGVSVIQIIKSNRCWFSPIFNQSEINGSFYLQPDKHDWSPRISHTEYLVKKKTDALTSMFD